VADSTTCERHGTPTHIACATCATPICPQCLVRTPVGFKCRTCTSGSGRGGRRRWLRPVAMGALAVGVLALPSGVRLLAERDDGDPPAAATSTATAGVGEEVRDAGLSFVVRSFDCETGVDAQTCRLGVSAINHGAGPEELFGRLQFLVDDAGRRYGPEEGMGLFSEELNPEEEGELRLIFDLPPAITINEAELHTYPGSLGARVQLRPITGAS
jgi:hypothetical protein